MEKETVMIFTGAEYLEVGAEYFFQHPDIESMSQSDVKQYYGVTRIALTSMKDLVKMVAEGKEVEIGTARFTPEFIGKLERGLGILEVMLVDLLGDKDGQAFINKSIKELLNESY